LPLVGSGVGLLEVLPFVWRGLGGGVDPAIGIPIADTKTAVLQVLIYMFVGAAPCWLAIVVGLVVAKKRAPRPLQLAAIAAAVVSLPLAAECLWWHELARSLGYESRHEANEAFVFVASWFAAGAAATVGLIVASVLARRAQQEMSGLSEPAAAGLRL
jgi:hypothetical protein